MTIITRPATTAAFSDRMFTYSDITTAVGLIGISAEEVSRAVARAACSMEVSAAAASVAGGSMEEVSMEEVSMAAAAMGVKLNYPAYEKQVSPFTFDWRFDAHSAGYALPGARG